MNVTAFNTVNALSSLIKQLEKGIWIRNPILIERMTDGLSKRLVNQKIEAIHIKKESNDQIKIDDYDIICPNIFGDYNYDGYIRRPRESAEISELLFVMYPNPRKRKK